MIYNSSLMGPVQSALFSMNRVWMPSACAASMFLRPSSMKSVYWAVDC